MARWISTSTTRSRGARRSPTTARSSTRRPQRRWRPRAIRRHRLATRGLRPMELDPFALITALFILVLAAFVGYEVVSKVPTMLHTPLMSGANAIHGVIVVGAMLVAATADSVVATILALLAVILGTINVVGGFVVTDRMLEMFKGRGGDRR